MQEEKRMEKPTGAESGIDQGNPVFRVVLVSPPWALFHRPSIQLASLESYLRQQSDYPVESHHLSLNIAARIGIDLYTRISKSGWAGEALFAPLLFPEKKAEAARLFRQELREDGNDHIPDFDRLSADMVQVSDTWLSTIEPGTISLCGFSVCFSQLFPSLYLAAKLKEAAPVATVFGGTSCSSEAGRSLVSHFEQIDHLIDGEGEKALLELCNYLSEKRSTLPGGVSTRNENNSVSEPLSACRLDDLPIPSFTSYLSEVKHLFPDVPFMPVLPVEFSRGCSWNRCTFCNLNLQWKGYRHKKAGRMSAEVLQLVNETESLSFSFTDNVLPERETTRFFKAMSETGKDLSFFAEIRAKTAVERLELFRSGGLQTVQVGIESLSGSLLARMGKGTTVMDNLAIMKNCSASGIILMGNIITQFPGSSSEEAEETLENLDYAFPFFPLDAVPFFLGYGSPVYRNPKKYGIRAITAHPKNRMLFPRELKIQLLACGYRGDRAVQIKRWRPVLEKIKAWQRYHRKRSQSDKPPLYYRDGGSFLVIHQQRPDSSTLLHRLRGTSRELYLFCDQPKKLEEICRAYPRLSHEAIKAFVRQLCEKRLMFRENERVLALAVRFA